MQAEGDRAQEPVGDRTADVDLLLARRHQETQRVDDVDEVVEHEAARLARHTDPVLLHKDHGPVQPSQRRVRRCEAAVEADRERPPLPIREVDQVPRIREAGRERFVHQHVNAGGQQMLDQAKVSFGGGVHEGHVDSAVEQIVEPCDAPGRAVLPAYPGKSVIVSAQQRQGDVGTRREHRQVGLLRDITQPNDPHPQRLARHHACSPAAVGELPGTLPTAT
ncbi:MAG TPA: hypothetical protein VFE92_05380 [Dermatophilaceae bacterium]|nr:hypothetical protein [Dermatophilaceae bacterium]